MSSPDPPEPRKPFKKRIENGFERVLWNCRFAVLIAVIGAMVGALSMFLITSFEIVYVVESLGPAMDHSPDHGYEGYRSGVVTRLVEAIDGYLLATAMIIFSFGLYELFISKIDPAAKSERASKILIIESFDDLKDRLSKVVVLLLIVKFFGYAVSIIYVRPADLLQLAGAIALIAIALYLSHQPRGNRQNHSSDGPAPNGSAK